MAIFHDQDKDVPAGLESAARDLEIPEAVAERTVGGDSTPYVITSIPGRVKWEQVQLKIGITGN